MNISVSKEEFELIQYGLELLMSHKAFKSKEYNEIERLYDSLKEQQEEWFVSNYTPCNDVELAHKH